MQTAPMQEEAPPEAQLYHGGVARLPVSDRMFGYANGGIIAFRTGERPEDKEGYEGSDDERKPLRHYTLQEQGADWVARKEAARAAELERQAAEAAAAQSQPPRPPYTGPQQYTLQQQGEDWVKRKAAAREANAPAREAAIAQGREDFRAGIANLIAGTGPQGVKPAIPVAAPPVSNIPRREAPPPRLPDGRPNPAYAAFIENEAKRDRGADPFAYDESKFPMPAGGIPTAIKDQKPTVYSGPSTVDKSAIATLPGGTPAPGKVTTTPGGAAAAPGGTKSTGNTTPIVLDDLEKVARELVTGGGYKPSTPKSVEELDKEKQDFVAKQPTSEEALAMIKHLDRMAKRYEANDQAEEAQRARNASNNLWTFLMNTRGSSLGVAAGKANAALQPLLSEQEARRQSYQKQRDEQEMALGKYRYELAQAERARKEGRFDDARKHQMEAQKAELDVAKLAEQERGNKVQGINALLRNKETQRHHEETMARLRSSDAQRAQEHAERMAFREKEFGSKTDLAKQRLMQTNPNYKTISDMLLPYEMQIASAKAKGKKVSPELEAQAAALRMQKQQIEAQFGITDAAPSDNLPGRKVIDFNTIGK
jgi:hypothetical protein